MNPEVKEVWTAALESGEFEQTNGKLHDSKGAFCCLGVLCELYRRAHPETSRWVVGDFAARIFSANTEFNAVAQSRLVPPLPVYQWAGLTELPNVTVEGVTTSVVSHNDGSFMPGSDEKFPRRTFKQLAAAIKEQL
jgi:hypothetical protein